MTLIRQLTRTSKFNVRQLLINKSPTSLTQQRSRHILSTAHHHQHEHQQQHGKNFRYVSIPPNSGSGTTNDDEFIISDEELIERNTRGGFNEDDYFKSTDMEFYDDATNMSSSSTTSSNSSASLSLDSAYDSKPSKTASEEEEEKDFERRQAVRDELDSRTGRLWEDPWAITDEDWSSGRSFDDLPDWTEKLCSRVSKERVKLHPDGVPTLVQLAALQHEPSATPHPALGNPKPYLKHRKQAIYNTVYDAVVAHAEPKVKKILAMEKWEEKQNAIDDLFEEIHDKVRYNTRITQKKNKNGKKSENAGLSGKSEEEYKEYMSIVLGSQPNFPKLVQGALENYLKNVVKEEKSKVNGTIEVDVEKNEPIFMDILKATGSTVDEDDVPKLLAPIKPHTKDGPGRMLEEWELSAKRDTKRIMLRECITEIAKSMVETQGENAEKGSRIFVNGQEGVGKSSTLAALVASARMSGHIVLYIPDGRRFSHLGFYLEPNAKSKADGNLLFDLPLLTNEVCSQFLKCHEKDLEGMVVASDTLMKYLTSDQLKKSKDLPESEGDTYLLIDLLKIGSENVTIGASCYQAVIDSLMNQSDKPFTVIMDEFNCYFDQGHYYHAQYDSEVKKSIPLNKITLFKHFMDAVGVEKLDDGTIVSKEATPMKRGSIVVGTSESHAVKRTFTAILEEAVVSAGCKSVTVPQYSPLEVEHILANFEIIGIGRLRFDRGATVMNNQEVSFLRMVSGGVGQKLLDSCVH